MKKLSVLSMLCFQCVYADPALEGYLSYIEQLSQSVGNHQEGEIEIVTNPKEIYRVQQAQESRLMQKGYTPDQAAQFSRVGIIGEDQYWIWIRDAVYFPRGACGTYDRLLRKKELESKCPGVAVLPVSSSGQVMLVLNYRHATRSWELELPRGGLENEESFEEAALRELKEETGLVASSVTFLGEIATDTGVRSSITPVFLARVVAKGQSTPECSEAIAGVVCFSKEELKKGLVQGFVEVSIQGNLKRVPLRDAFLTFALLQSEMRSLF